MVYNCTLCAGFCALTLHTLLNHLGRCHRSDPGFHVLCGIDSCPRTYTNCNAFRNHITKVHGHILIAETENNEEEIETAIYPPVHAAEYNSDIDEDNDDIGMCEDPTHPFNIDREKEGLKRANALTLLKIREEGKLTQKSLNVVANSATEIVRSVVSVLKAGVATSLEQTGYDFRTIPGLSELFSDESVANNPFVGIATESEQCQYYREHFNLVEPRGIVLGQRHVQARRGNKIKAVRKSDQVYYVPLLQSLEQLLNNESVLQEVEHPHQRNDNLLGDYCDGEDFENHPLFSSNPRALQILLYFDEVELCNPLGSKANKHKLGAFYYTLGNIRPQNRSHQNAIQLLALAPSSYLKKYGPDEVLEPFMQDLNLLEQDAGFEFNIGGEPRSFQGTIAFFSGDNLGSQFIGGFKEGSQAHRKCRECMGGTDDIQTKFHERDFVLRTRASYNHHCEHIRQEEYYSFAYGIKRQSPLNGSRFFHVVGGLPGDAMHDVLEGMLQYEVKELLNELINAKKLFTLQELNKRMADFDYGYYNDSNKPLPHHRETIIFTRSQLEATCCSDVVYSCPIPSSACGFFSSRR